MSPVLASGNDGSGLYGLDCTPEVVDWIPKNTALLIRCPILCSNLQLIPSSLNSSRRLGKTKLLHDIVPIRAKPNNTYNGNMNDLQVQKT